jgi:L-ascorbate metabolism protein UlaG (beta-lactamase superfamily)
MRSETTTVTLTLIGGPTLLIEMGGLRILTDPTFDAPGTYQGGVELHKLTAPAIDSTLLLPIDIVLLSHDQHFDNLDHAGRAFLPQAGRVLTTTAGAGRLRESVKRVEGLEPGHSVTLPAKHDRQLRITATPARHGPHGFEPISGDVIGFVLGLGDANVYVSGDTVWYEGVADLARRVDIDLAILFAGAARPRGAFHVTMDNNDVVEAAHAFGDATIVAIHNEGWQHLSESQTDVATLFGVLGLPSRLQLLERGVPVSLDLP